MKCEKHDEKMVPVSYMMKNGIAEGTAYACRSCIKERPEGAPIKIFEGPVDHSLDDDDSPYKLLIKISDTLERLERLMEEHMGRIKVI